MVRLCAIMLIVVFAETQSLAHQELLERIAAVTAQLGTNQNSAELHLIRADLFRQHREFDAALADLQTASTLRTNWPATFLQRARIYFDSEDFAACIAAVGDCLALDPGNADALILRARSLNRLKNQRSLSRITTPFCFPRIQRRHCPISTSNAPGFRRSFLILLPQFAGWTKG